MNCSIFERRVPYFLFLLLKEAAHDLEQKLFLVLAIWLGIFRKYRNYTNYSLFGGLILGITFS